jgi:arylformamidase
MKVFDITPEISSGIAVFPGDVAFSREVSLDFEKGDHLRLSSIRTTLHLGAHADSSSHYHAQGLGVEERPLLAYFGSVQVISVPQKKAARISPQDLKTKIKAPRVLLKTASFPDPRHWNNDFMSLSPELIHFLHSQGVILVGIDTPSVDPAESKALESHQALYETKMAVLEGLVLRKVPDGIYSMVALPLPIQNADASPVRALLFDEPALFPDQVEIVAPV